MQQSEGGGGFVRGAQGGGVRLEARGVVVAVCSLAYSKVIGGALKPQLPAGVAGFLKQPGVSYEDTFVTPVEAWPCIAVAVLPPMDDRTSVTAGLPHALEPGIKVA